MKYIAALIFLFVVTATAAVVLVNPSNGSGVSYWTNASSVSAPINNQACWVDATNGNDSTALISNPGFPFQTVSAAVLAMRTNGGTIYFAPGRYTPLTPWHLLTARTNDAGTNTLRFQGAGQPFPDSNRNPTFLVSTRNSTVIEGPFVLNRPNVEFYDLGVDTGPVVCTNYYGAATNADPARDCLSWHTYNQEFVLTNVVNHHAVAKRISCLGYKTNSAAHAFLFENVVDGVLEDISTWHNTHGIVIKGWRVQGRGLQVRGHSSNGIIIKGDSYAIPGLLHGHDEVGYNANFGVGQINLTDVTIEPLRYSWDTPGIRFLSSEDGAHIGQTSISAYTYNGSLFAARFEAGTNVTIAGVQIWCAGFPAPTVEDNGNSLGSVYFNGVAQ